MIVYLSDVKTVLFSVILSYRELHFSGTRLISDCHWTPIYRDYTVYVLTSSMSDVIRMLPFLLALSSHPW